MGNRIRSRCQTASIAACGAAFLLVGVHANAAVIAWSSPQAITGDSDVSTLGTTFGAVHFSSPAPNTTVNGVTFTGVLPITSPSITSGDFTLTTAANAFANGNGGSASPPFSNLSSQYQALLVGMLGVNSSPFSATLTINNLTLGAPYQFQWWFNFSTAGAGANIGTATAGTSVTLAPNPSNTNGGLGQFAIGTFVADSTSQTIVFTGNGAALLNGFQLRVVPEPASLAVLSLAAIGLLRRRRSGTAKG